MSPKLLRSPSMHAMVIVYVLIASGFVLLSQAHAASAQPLKTELVTGLQNDMVDLNNVNPSTNSVWKFYQISWSLETLLGRDPSYQLFGWLADPTKGISGPGWTTDASGLNVTVYLRSGVTFSDGKPFTADDVVFSYQALAWSTAQASITNGLWWDAPKEPLWNATTCTPPGGMPYACMSHVGVKKIDATTVLFQLAAPYALFYSDSLVLVPMVPQHIWADHINPAPQVNITDPNLGKVKDTWDRSIDFSFGSKSTDTAATIGTGMFKLDSWSPKLGSHISVNTGYWGKTVFHTWNGVNYYFYPKYLQSIRFIIYTSLDVASLALQSGEIDTLVWPLTGGFLTQVQYNPAISVEQVTDDGFYYLAFNMRRSPWNDVNLRTAVSMAVDKDYITKTLLGGFGSKGTVPLSVINPAYINTSASPPTFNLQAAAALLDSAGYKINPATGFRTTPSGAPLATTILTPPKDYDPVRADAGIMISNNLKSIGLDIDSAPTSFDTIVAKAFSPPVDFDMYILGWVNNGPFPETYLPALFEGKYDVNLNPAGANSPGYHNKAFDTLIEKALVTLDDTARQHMFWDLEGNLTRDLPYDVLYYRKNLNAYRNDAWVGYVNTPPDIFNFWSLVNLRPAGTVSIPPPTGVVTIAATVPERAIADHSLTTDVFVSQAAAPLGGAAVYLNGSLASGQKLFTATGTTDASGHASIQWTTPVIQGNMILTLSAAKGGSSGSATKQLVIVVGPPAPMATLSLSTPTPVISPGQTATITASLVDGLGQPAASQKVFLDTTLVLGTLSPSNATTDSTGKATFTYTAPPDAKKFVNSHLIDTIRATVNVPGTIVGDTQTAFLTMFVQNDNAPIRTIVSIQGTPQIVMSPLSTTTTINVKVASFQGAAMSGIDVDPILPSDGSNNVTVAAASAGSNKTNALGVASFTVTETSAAVLGANVTNIGLRFQARNQVFAVSDEVMLLVTDGVTAGYAAQLMVNTRAVPYSATPVVNNVTALVYNQLNLKVSGAQVIFQINYGPLGLPAEFQWSYDYGNPKTSVRPSYLGHGLDLNSFGIGSLGGSFAKSKGNSGTDAAFGVENFVEDVEVVGDFATATTNFGYVIDSCDPTTYPTGFDGLYYLNATSVTNATGQVTANWTANPEKADQGFQVRAYVGLPGANLRVIADACNFVSSIDNSSFALDSGVAAQRAPVFGMGLLTTSLPIFTSAATKMQVTATFYKLGGAVASGLQVFLTKGVGTPTANVLGAFGGTFTTNAAGQVIYNTTITPLSLSQPFYYHFLPADPAFAFGAREQLFSGSFGDYWFSPNAQVLLVKYPFDWVRGYLFIPSSVGFATASVSKTLSLPGSLVQATVNVVTGAGTPIEGAAVWSGPVRTTTDASGNALINFTASFGAMENLAVVTTPDGQVIRNWYSIMASGPILTYGTITSNVAPAGSPSTFSLTVTNTLPVAGPATVTMMVGTNTVAAQVVNIAASGTATVTFQYAFPSSGSNTVTIGTASTSVSVPAPEASLATTTAYALAIGLLIAGLVVGAVLGLILSRRGKKPPTATREEETELPEEGGKPAEEELGPEHEL